MNLTWESTIQFFTLAGVVWTMAEVFFGQRGRLDVLTAQFGSLKDVVDGHPKTVSEQLQGIRDAIDRLQEDIRELRGRQ